MDRIVHCMPLAVGFRVSERYMVQHLSTRIPALWGTLRYPLVALPTTRISAGNNFKYHTWFIHLWMYFPFPIYSSVDVLPLPHLQFLPLGHRPVSGIHCSVVIRCIPSSRTWRRLAPLKMQRDFRVSKLWNHACIAALIRYGK